MNLDGKLGIVLVMLAFLLLIYLDNAGKLGPALALISGPAIDDGAAIVAAPVSSVTSSTSSGVYVPPGGIAPAPVTVGSGKLGTPSTPGGTITIKGVGGPVHVPYAPPLPWIKN